MLVLALLWLFPLLWSLYNSFREYSYTQTNGYFSLRWMDARQLQGGVEPGQLRAAPKTPS